MLVIAVVALAFAIVYVALVAPLIAVPPELLFVVFLYHWYVKFDCPVAATLNVTSWFPCTTDTDCGCAVIPPTATTESFALLDVAVVTPSFGSPYFCVTMQ